MRAPILSVIVPAFNEQAWLAGTLGSIAKAAAAEVDGDVQMIVVDNASTDATPEIAHRLGAEVVAEHRQGVAFARNAGATAARAPLLVWVDADTVLPAGLLGRILAECRGPHRRRWRRRDATPAASHTRAALAWAPGGWAVEHCG